MRSCIKNSVFGIWQSNHRLVFQTLQPPEEPPFFEPGVEVDAQGRPIKPGPEQRQELSKLQEDIDKSGEAKDYIEAFDEKKNPRNLEALSAILQFGNQADIKGLTNCKLWVTRAEQNPNAIADLFENTQFIPFPPGKGKRAFIDGLRKDPSDPAFKESMRVLKEISQKIDSHINSLEQHKADLKSIQQDKPFGNVIGDASNSLKESWNRSRGWGKAKIAAGLAFIGWMIWKYKDELVPGFDKLKWKTIFTGIAGFFLVDELSSHVSKDRRKLTQKLFDFRPALDAIKSDNHPVKGFGEEYKMKEDQEKWLTLNLIWEKNLTTLYPLYREQKLKSDLAESKKSIDPKRLGFSNNEISGAKAYQIMDHIAEKTYRNKHAYEQEAKAREAEGAGTKYEKEEIGTISPGKMLQAFEEKYISQESPIGITSPTLFDAIAREYPSKEAAAAIEQGQQARKFERGKKWVGEQYDEYGKTKEGKYVHEEAWRLTKGAGGAIAGAAGIAWKKGLKPAWKEGIVPAAEATAYAGSRYLLKPLSNTVEQKLAESQEGELRQVLPADYDIRVITPQIPTRDGLAYVMGYPVKFATSREPEGKKLVIIEGIKFDLALKTSGENVDAEKELKGFIAREVAALVKAAAKKNPGIAKISPTWLPAEEKWVLKKVKVSSTSSLKLAGIPQDITFTINEKKELNFSMNDTEVPADFKNLDIVYRNSVIQEKIWTNSNFGRYLKGLPVKVSSVKPHSEYKAIIKGEIAGLAFTAVPLVVLPYKPDINNGIDFLDTSTSPPTIDATGATLAIEQKNGGDKFLEALTQKINRSPYFNDAFVRLKSQMDNADEGVLDRLQTAAETKLWIIPTNVRGFINGKILNKAWDYTLNFKRDEALSMFYHALDGKKISDIKTAYTGYIEGTVKKLDELSQYIASLSPKQKAQQFDNLLRGPGNPPTKPAGLEYINYSNDAYQKLFKKYQAMLRRYNYEGIENVDSSLSDSAYDLYNLLLTVWSFHTKEYIEGELEVIDPKSKEDTGLRTTLRDPDDELTPERINIIEVGVIDKIREKLDFVTQGGKPVSKAGLAKAGLLPNEEKDLNKWIL